MPTASAQQFLHIQFFIICWLIGHHVVRRVIKKHKFCEQKMIHITSKTSYRSFARAPTICWSSCGRCGEYVALIVLQSCVAVVNVEYVLVLLNHNLHIVYIHKHKHFRPWLNDKNCVTGKSKFKQADSLLGLRRVWQGSTILILQRKTNYTSFEQDSCIGIDDDVQMERS